MRILVVTNMYPTPYAPASGTFVEQQIKGLRQIGLEVEVMFVDRLQRGMATYLKLRRQIRLKIEHCQPQIVHVMYGGVLADQITRTVDDRPTVVTFHGSDLLGEHLSGVVRKLTAGYGVWASWQAARRADRIVVVSKILYDVLPKDIDRSKVRIIPCGIDLDRFKPLSQKKCRDRLGWNAERFHLLFPSYPGNSVKRYGLARVAVEALSRQGIHAEMHCLQGVSNDDVPIWLNASDVILLTSQHEGSPTVIKEALACNVPIVSVDVGDVRERIAGIEGCYLALPDPNDLAAKLHLVYAGSRRVAGREKVQELALQRVAGRLKEFYSDLLHSRSLGPYPVSS
jgi:teichuronic acid biosynthesis glycosyltransferase TuaC